MRNFDKKYLIYQLLCFCGHNPYISHKFTEFSVWFLLELKQKEAKTASTLQPFQDSEGTSTSTETNNTSYESPDTQLFGATRMRAWHHHGGATPTFRKTVCNFFFWGRRSQEGWIFLSIFWLGQNSASHECTNTIFMI